MTFFPAIQRSAFRPTETISVEAESVVPSAPRGAFPGRRGVTLGRGDRQPGGAHQLLPEQEIVVQNRLAMVIAAGREREINQLMHAMRAAPLLPQERELLEEWEKAFLLLNRENVSERAWMLGVLTGRILRPAIARDETFTHLDLLCSSVLQKMLPAGTLVEKFLQQCELGLVQERLFIRVVEREEQLMDRLYQELEENVHGVNSQLEHASERMSQNLRTTYERQQEVERVGREQIVNIQAQWELLNGQFIDQVTSIAQKHSGE